MAKSKVIIKDNIYNSEIHKPIDYTFEKVIQLKDNEWSTHIDAETLGKLWMDQKLVYYPDSQRGLKIQRNKEGELEEKAVFSAKNIKEIQESIMKNTYHPDQITLNLLSNGSDVTIYDNYELEVEGLLCVLDGQHRLKAIANILQANEIVGVESDKYKDLSSLVFPVKITNYNKNEAAQQFYQYTKGMRISKSLAESFNKKDAINRIVDDLNKSGALKDKIDKVKTSISASDSVHLTTFSTMVNAITDSYGQIDDEQMREDVLDFLLSFFEQLTKIFPELVNDKERQLSKKYALTCENFMFYGWIEISQLLYCNRFNDGQWKQQLAKISDIDFSRYHFDEESNTKGVNPIWIPILRHGDGRVYIVNSKSTRQVLRRIIREQFYKAQSK